MLNVLGGVLESSNIGAPEGSVLCLLLVSQIPPAKAATSNTKAPMAIPAMGPPPREELFFVVVDPEEEPWLLPPGLVFDIEEDDKEEDVDKADVGEFWEPGDSVVQGEAFVTLGCDGELMFPDSVDAACEPDEEIDDPAEGEVVVEAPGPAFAA